MGRERRKYIRISTVFPVEISLKDRKGKRLTPWLQGFTNNISYGGIYLVINDLWWGFWDRFKEGTPCCLCIHLPLKEKCLTAEGVVVWRDKEKTEEFDRYGVGIQFTKIDKRDQRLLFRYAITKKFIPYLINAVVVFLVGISIFLVLRQTRLIEENKALVADYHKVLERTNNLKEALSEEKELVEFFKRRQQKLVEERIRLEEEIKKWQSRYEQLVEKKEKTEEEKKLVLELEERIESLKKTVAVLQKENTFLKEKLKEKKLVETKLSKKIEEVEKEAKLYVPKIIKGMYEWIALRQDLKSGLVLSYEGDKDLDKVAFSYDQALACIVFCIERDFERAKRILNFYCDRIRKGEPIYNAYYTNGNVFEYVIHSGPNAWIGIATLNYTKLTKDKSYLVIAKYVADFLVRMMDKEGGVIGGPQVKWYSTEHNLDAYAFFYMFYTITKNQRYLNLAKKIESWLDKYAYTHKEVPVNRGKGDATIATDTFAWSITAVGPEELLSLKMDPDMIMDFAIKNCEVKTKFIQGNRMVEVRGFDFSKARNIARGGVISCEWTSQMILAFLIMADYYKDRDDAKFDDYLHKAIYYFYQLQRMIISSPSFVGKANPTLPYASSSFVDTGHGWRTPKGDRVGSLASTAYFLLTWWGYNPLKGEFLRFSLKELYEKGNRRVNLQTY